ncbi:hypothetical protein [Streptomyces sp. BA2]|uniref:hypothetical protein n=1 Tax=Streptomyces sp. BA2 TaxID=436595 RepID=UPI001329E0B7|nr:hypothetical protein [Streptomyces sp. BA2]MWA16173.1 hypothetical protein [Streptomyces sp. BA2]
MAAALSAALTVAAPTAAFATSRTGATASQPKPDDDCARLLMCETADDWFHFEDESASN